MWLKEIKWKGGGFGQISRNYFKKSRGNSKLGNITEMKNQMGVFSSRMEITKERINDRINSEIKGWDIRQSAYEVFKRPNICVNSVQKVEEK